MNISASIRHAFADARSVIVTGLVIIVAGLVLTRVLREPLLLNVDAQEFLSSSVERFGVALADPFSPWATVMWLAGIALILAFIYGIVVGSGARVEIAAGLTRRRVHAEGVVYLAVTCTLVLGLFIASMLLAFALDPRPALREGSAPLLMMVPLTAMMTLAAAAVGHMVGLTFLRFHWLVGVLLVVTMFGAMFIIDALPETDGNGEMLLTFIGATGALVIAGIGSRLVIRGMETAR